MLVATVDYENSFSYMDYTFCSFLQLFTAFCQSQVFVKSEHSIKPGLAEKKQFPKTCVVYCSLSVYLDVSKLHFDDVIESGAYIVIFGQEEGESFFHSELKRMMKLRGLN